MAQKSSFIVIGVVAILIAGLVVWGVLDGKKKSSEMSVDDTALNNQFIYYYGEECPHCQRVQAFLDENKVADKFTYEKKEVWHNEKNNAEMLRRAQSVCKLDPKQLGVPFVIADGKCFSGEDEVTDIFKQKAGI